MLNKIIAAISAMALVLSQPLFNTEVNAETNPESIMTANTDLAWDNTTPANPANDEWILKSDYEITVEKNVQVSDIKFFDVTYNGGTADVYTIHFPKNTEVADVPYAYTVNEKYNYVLDSAPIVNPIIMLSFTRLGYIVDDENNILAEIYAVADRESAIVGDVSLDGKVNSIDIIEMLKFLGKSTDFSPQQRTAADCYAADGYINVQDLVALIKYALGEINSLPMYLNHKIIYD